jgi:tetraacyldisaccharide 4'-kinase
MSRLLAPLQFPYAVALAAKNQAYDHGWRRSQRLAWPVVSVGNLSVGGAGKTPFTAELARLLQAGGIHVDILSRGYGRRSPVAVERVPPGNGNARRYGDEPILLADATGAPAYVGTSRYAAGLLAEHDASGADGLTTNTGQTPPRIHLLDDGFQHRQLARSVDIVLLHPRDAQDALLPAGRLREPISALRRADFLVLREDDEQTLAALQREGIDKPVWRMRRTLSIPSVDGPAVAFAAIAHPEEFFAQLRAAGLELTRTFAFRDHHRFSKKEMSAIAAAGRQAAGVVTTEKDIVRLTMDARMALGTAVPLFAARLNVELPDATQCLLALRLLLGKRSAPPAMRK